MKTQGSAKPFGFAGLSAVLRAVAVFCMLGASCASAQTTINIVAVDPDGNSVTPPSAYRWTVEEDRTRLSVPGQPSTRNNLSFSFHPSFMPVVAAGRVGAAGIADPRDPDVARLYGQTLEALRLDPAKRYFVSVAAEGFQIGGAPVAVGANGAGTATVKLIQYPVKTAQLSIFVFNDNFPVNNTADLPQEQGLEGFTIQLLEAGGTYGQSGGQVTQDAFGNPLGTTYVDGNPTNVKQLGTGIIKTDANGVAIIKNLYPAKYTILVVPRIRPGEEWHQTSTIEGTKGVDAWVKANEPPGFYEFGPPGYHVFYGFVNAANGGCLQGKNSNGTCIGLDPNGAGQPVTGRIVSAHDARPPTLTIDTGPPVPECWVALNNTATGQGLIARACNKDSTFSIPNVPPGTYQLVVWDEPLDTIIGFSTVVVGNSPVDLGNVPQLAWFGRYQGRVFQDIDGTGLPYFVKDYDRPYVYVNPMTGVEELRQQNFKAGDLKPALGAGVASNIRFRDGSIYQSNTTKDDGTFAFTEVFPFFNWMVAEIDYARFKATSANIVVDNGGPINAADNLSKLWGKNPTTPYKGQFGTNDPALAYDPWTRINPQPQPENGGKLFRTESCNDNAEFPGQCAILLEGMSLYANQTNHVEWGKVPYTIEENGGIAGIVYYAITRAEDDPRYAAAENWEPGIPRVQVNVYLDCDGDGKVDGPLNDGSGQCDPNKLSTNGYVYEPADVDNYPFCWRDPGSCGLLLPQMGPEDVKRVINRSAVAAHQSEVFPSNPTVGVDDFLYGDAFRWGAPFSDPGTSASLLTKQQAQTTWGLGKTDAWDDAIPSDCPTRFIGDPKFTIPYGDDAGVELDCWDGLRNWNQLRPGVFDGGYAFGRVAGQPELPMIIGAAGKGTYVVEAVAPPGYLHQGNGDKNVVFGDEFQSRPAALPHECVGMELAVPQYLTLFEGIQEPNPNFGSPQYPGNLWRKCDMKAVPLLPGMNAAPNFFLFTEAPVAAHGMGLLTDDLNNTFDPLSPNYGEKYAPPYVPISVQDWQGHEIQRVYSDQYGRYNFLVPSTFTINPPYPSGVMPNMIQACLNHPGPIPVLDANGAPVLDANGQPVMQLDPYFSRRYTQQCYTLQYLPGKTTYLDTPMLPAAAFAPVEKTPLDCECENKTPGIYSVTGPGNVGPWVDPTGTRVLTIVSSGNVEVPNPAFDPAVQGSPRTIVRDYGFGDAPGSVMVGSAPLSGVTWANGVITGTVPASVAAGQYQLTIRRGDNGKESVVGLTVHVGGTAPKKVPADFPTIQAAINAANNGDLITIAPGSYNEALILDKRIRLQGWGAGSTFVNPIITTGPAPVAWRDLLNSKAITPTNPNGTFNMLPGQTLEVDPATGLSGLLGSEEQSGVLVLGRMVNTADPTAGCLNAGDPLRVDGLAITGSITGGGILANGYACGLQISNNRVFGNTGTYGGGVRIGHTALVSATSYVDAVNRNVSIHHNWIAENGGVTVGVAGGTGGGAGGVTLGTGSSNYGLTSNYICGNFTLSDGAGISHYGQSNGGTIARNTIIFNQNFDQGLSPSGGGLSIAAPLPVGGGLAAGTGDVAVNANLFQGNQAGAGAGGAVSIARTLPADDVVLTNNMIINNVTAYAGAVALSGVTNSVRLVNNTIASNVSTATSQQAFAIAAGAPTNPQVAGIALLDGAIPRLLNNIVWGNRSYIFAIGGATSGLYNPGTTVDNGTINANPTPSYRDLGAVTGGPLEPRYSVLTDTAENRANYSAGSQNAEASCSNTGPSPGANVRCNKFEPVPSAALFTKVSDFTDSLQSAVTVDEGGNFINVIFSPLTLWDIDANGTVLATPRADYHIKPGSIALNNARSFSATDTAIGANYVPSTDFDAEGRATPVDIGADEIPITADLAVTKTDALTYVTRGTTGVTYSIVVTNAGPDPVTNATLTDTLPGGTRFAVSSWTCTASAGSSCTVTGTGNTTRGGSVSLAVGGTATYTLAGSIPANAPLGNSTNSVTISGGGNDPTPGNNTATDTDVITLPAAVSFTGEAGPATLTGTTLAFGNQNGQVSDTVTLTVGGTLPVTFGTATVTNAPTQSAFSKGADTCSGTTKNPGDTCTITVNFNGPPGNSARSGTLSVPHNRTGSPATLSLTGN